MALDKITRDLAVLKTNGSFSAIISGAGNVQFSYGDGTKETGTNFSKTFNSFPPYLINVKDNEDSITTIDLKNNNLSDVSIEPYKNLLNLDVSNNSLDVEVVSEVLNDLDETSNQNGTASIKGNNYLRSQLNEEVIGSLESKGWDLSQGLWSPSRITTEGWWDASDTSTIYQDDMIGSVSRWDDKSGNGYSLSQVIGAKQPTIGTRSINGLNAIDFNEEEFMLNTTNSSSIVPANTKINVFSVLQFDLEITNIVVYAKDGSSGVESGSRYNGGGGSADSLEVQMISTLANKSFTFFQDGSDTQDEKASASGTTLLETTQAHLIYGLVDRESANPTVETWLNGTQEGTDSGAGTANDITCKAFILGSHGSTDFSLDRRFDGILGETIVVHGTLTTQNRQLIEGYLAHKWGLTANLPIDHPYKTDGSIFGY
jgi:hypothetical protein